MKPSKAVTEYKGLWTRFWERAEVVPVAQEAIDVYTAIWILRFQLVNTRLILSLMRSYLTEVKRLAGLAERLEPELSRIHEDELFLVIDRLLVRQVAEHFNGRDAVKVAMDRLPRLHVRGVPGTSLRFDDNGHIDPRGATKQDLLRSADFVNLDEPAGKPGHPKGKTRRRDPKIDQEEEETARLVQQGASDREIARKLYGTTWAKFDPAIARKVQRRKLGARKKVGHRNLT